MQEFIKNLIVEGSRIFWTAVEAGAGFLAAWVVPDTWFDFAGAYEPVILGAIVVTVAAVATKLKEIARHHLTRVTPENF